MSETTTSSKTPPWGMIGGEGYSQKLVAGEPHSYGGSPVVQLPAVFDEDACRKAFEVLWEAKLRGKSTIDCYGLYEAGWKAAMGVGDDETHNLPAETHNPCGGRQEFKGGGNDAA